jgi:hypothetical protein
MNRRFDNPPEKEWLKLNGGPPCPNDCEIDLDRFG